MNKLIAYCGLNCEECDAYVATKNNDQTLREKTAKLWTELNNAHILPEQIHCEGCRTDGIKTIYCNTLCEIRKCSTSKDYENCGECVQKETCTKIAPIWQHNPQAKKNLEE